MFGINLDDTYERAWYRANNPPTVNIVVPPDIKDDGFEYAQEELSYIPKWANGNVNAPYDDLSEFDKKENGFYNYGEVINHVQSIVKFSKRTGTPYYLYSDGPEDILDKRPQSLITYYPIMNNDAIVKTAFGEKKEKDIKKHQQPNRKLIDTEKPIPKNQKIDIGLYHKNGIKDADLLIGVVIKNNHATSPARIQIWESSYSFGKLEEYNFNTGLVKMETKTNLENDEREKENMCSEIELGFLKAPSQKEIVIDPGQVRFIAWVKAERKYTNKDGDDIQSRIYGRIKIKCDNNDNIYVRVISTAYDSGLVHKERLNYNLNINYQDILVNSKNINNNKLNDLWKNAYKLEPCSSGQFSGLIDYTEMDVKLTNMSAGQCILLGAYERPYWPQDNGACYPKSYGEYPETLYYKENGKNYYFGNFGIIHHIKFTWNGPVKPNNWKIRIFPFGHSVAMFANLLIDDGTGWKQTGTIERDKSNIINKEYDIFKKKDKENRDAKEKDVTQSIRYLNHYAGDKTTGDGVRNGNDIINIKDGISELNLKFLLPGGNCAGIKFAIITNKKQDIK